jgi:hypothetical protein
MRIHWPNIYALIFTIVASIVAIRHQAAIGTFLSSIAHIGPGHAGDEQTIGLIAFGIVAVLFVAVLRILIHNRKP